MNKILFIFFLVFFSQFCFSQQDERPIVGVSAFSCDENPRFVKLVTEKVVEMLTNTKRFRVVDRTSSDKVKEELELQKSEAFLDSKNIVEQGASLAAEKIITGHITKIPVYAIKNSIGEITGYKASIAFQMKIVDVASGLSTDATSFEGKASNLMLSGESAVQYAMNSIQEEINQYFKMNFPIKGKIIKILNSEDTKYIKVLLNIGKNVGLKIGDTLTVESIELIDGQNYPTKIGTIEIENLAGESFSEATVTDKKYSPIILSNFSEQKKLECTLTIKK